MDDASATAGAMNTTTDPNSSGSASLPTSLTGELQRLRHIPDHVFGWTQWWTHYEDINFGDRAIRNHLLVSLAGNTRSLYQGQMSALGSATRFHMLSFGFANMGVHHETALLQIHVNASNRLLLDLNGNLTLNGGIHATGGIVSGPVNLSGTGINAFHVGGLTFSSFMVTIFDNSGTLQHRITETFGTGNPTFAGVIAGASGTLQNTPTVGAVTNFTTGVGIHASATSQLIFNTGSYGLNSDLNAIAVINNYSGNNGPYAAILNSSTREVGGVPMTRLSLQLRHAGTGVLTPWTTAITGGSQMDIKVFGFLR